MRDTTLALAEGVVSFRLATAIFEENPVDEALTKR
jgi:hypothetical protein